MRLDKLLASRGGYSRKEAIELIRRRKVSVQDEICRDPKHHFEEDCELAVDGVAISPAYPLYLYHKPIGLISTMEDEWGRECMGDIVPVHYHLVGRLDKDTRGLLLFSRYGTLTQYLLHPKRAIEREYIATVEGSPTEHLVEVIEQGVETSVGLARGKIIAIKGSQIRLTMTEGRNRVVRRMLNNAGFPVLDLFRVRFGPFKLGDLEEGGRKAITIEELKQLGLIAWSID